MKKTFKELLIELRACDEAVKWAADRTIEQAVADCYRGDWLCWLAAKIELDKRRLVLVGGHIANTVRHLMVDERSRNAVDVCIAYGEGRATDEELALAAAVAMAAWAAVAMAAWAAVAAEAAADSQKQTADICRQYIGRQIVERVNEILNKP